MLESILFILGEKDDHRSQKKSLLCGIDDSSVLLALVLWHQGVEPRVVSVEHVFELMKSFKSIEYRHVDVKENERDRVKGLVPDAIIDIDVAQQNFKRFEDVLAIICSYQSIIDTQIDEIPLERLNVDELVVGVNYLSRLTVIAQEAMLIEDSQEF